MPPEDYMGNADHEPPPGFFDRWAVITSEGLTLYINLTEEEAHERAFNRRQNGRLSWAVTMEDAAELQSTWSHLGEVYAEKLRLERMRMVTEHLRERVFAS